MLFIWWYMQKDEQNKMPLYLIMLTVHHEFDTSVACLVVVPIVVWYYQFILPISSSFTSLVPGQICDCTVNYTLKNVVIWITSQIAMLMGPTWGPPGSCRPQVVGPMNLAIRNEFLKNNIVIAKQIATWSCTYAVGHTLVIVKRYGIVTVLLFRLNRTRLSN